jgi:plasmid stability protein
LSGAPQNAIIDGGECIEKTGLSMASMTIRDLDDDLKKRLRMRAARHGRSMEEEARDILRSALAGKAGQSTPLVESIRERFAPLGGVELQIAPREAPRGVLKFDE